MCEPISFLTSMFSSSLPAVSGAATTVAASMAAPAASTFLGMSAGTMSSLATGLSIAGAVTSIGGAYNKSKSDKAAYEYQAAVNRNNSTMAEWNARDAVTRGQKAEQQQRLKTAALRSTQRASFAARGMALDEGSPLSILDDTDFMGEQDALTLRDNAAREAWGYRVQAGNYASDAGMLSARADSESPIKSAGTTLLSSAGQVASSWYSRKTKTSGD